MKIFTWRQRGLVYLMTVIAVVVFGGIGYMLWSRAGLVGGIILSIPVNTIMLVRTMKREAEKITERMEKEEAQKELEAQE